MSDHGYEDVENGLRWTTVLVGREKERERTRKEGTEGQDGFG